MEKSLSENKKVLFLINTGSGTDRQADQLEKKIRSASEASKFTYKTHKLSGKFSASSIKKEIDDYTPDIVAACGGDGTVNLVATVLNGRDIPLLIVPCGSANGMSKELQITSVDHSIELLKTGCERKIDLLNINDKICIHLADIGLNARIVKRFEHDKKRGILTYAKHLFAEVFLLRQYRFKIVYCDGVIKRTAVSLTFANASKYGTGAVINATGKLNDGKFEIVIVKPFPSHRLITIAWKMFNGKLQTSEYVEVIRCTDAVVSCNKKSTFQIDGEIVGKIKHFDAKVLPEALTVIVPE